MLRFGESVEIELPGGGGCELFTLAAVQVRWGGGEVAACCMQAPLRARAPHLLRTLPTTVPQERGGVRCAPIGVIGMLNAGGGVIRWALAAGWPATLRL